MGDIQESLIDDLRAEIARLTAELADLKHDIERHLQIISNQEAERDALRADLAAIEEIANIAPIDDRYGSLATRMGKVWLLARGNASEQRTTEEPDWPSHGRVVR